MEIDEKIDNWRLWCRLCAKRDFTKNINMFLKNEVMAEATEEHRSLLAAIPKYFSIDIKYDEMLPKVICTECLDWINSLVAFSSRVEKVQNMYEAMKGLIEENTRINLNALRVKFGLSEAESQETHYFETKEEAENMEIMDSSSDPLEFPPVEVKIKIETNDDTIVESTDDLENPATTDSVDLNKSSTEKVDITNATDKKDSNKQIEQVATKKRIIRKRACKSAYKEDNANENETTYKMKFNENSYDIAYACDHCPSKYKRIQDLRYHIRRAHIKDTPPSKEYPCTQCTRIYPSPSSLRNHAQTHLPVELRKTFACHLCDRKFASNFGRQFHIKFTHLHEQRSFICEECGLTTSSKGNLNQHLLTHTVGKSVVCKVCQKSFKSAYNLKRHMETHAGKQICPECGLQLNTKTTLSQHLLVHSDEMKYKCDFCGRAFKRLKTLKIHLILHTGLKPYKCNFCDLTFANSSNCRLHMKKSHPEEFVMLNSCKNTNTCTPNISNISNLDTLTALIKSAQNVEAVESK